jgi:uncharacterized protein (TIGR01777 family)
MTSGSTVVIAGASGMIGTELIRQLTEHGHTCIRLVRRPARNHTERQWDPEVGWLNVASMDAADIVVNLAGATLSRLPWTLTYKKQILQSRLQTTSTLVAAIAKADRPPAVLINASAVGFYGSRPGEVLTEQSSRGVGFLPKVVDAWEKAADKVPESTRLVKIRTGLVVAAGGALKPLELLAKIGVAGPLGTGEQIWPWISLHDEVAAIRHLAFESELSGAVNLAGPTPVTAGTVIEDLAKQLHRPYWLPAPRWAISAALADAGRELLLSDQNVSAQRLAADGFVFRDTDISEAIAAALSKQN